jgi:3-oxo-4,17-pregnadiene-20-carboxyl-CoA hydratase beta subunit
VTHTEWPDGLVHPAPGDKLGPIRLRLTLQRLVMEAAADRDFAPSHHDPDYARDRGASSAFINFELAAAMFERLLREYAGPLSVLSHLRFRLIANAAIGTTLVTGGIVRDVQSDPSGRQQVFIDVWQGADEQETARGQARVLLGCAPGQYGRESEDRVLTEGTGQSNE